MSKYIDHVPMTAAQLAAFKAAGTVFNRPIYIEITDAPVGSVATFLAFAGQTATAAETAAVGGGSGGSGGAAGGKVQLTASGANTLTFALHNGKEVHAEGPVVSVILNMSDFPAFGSLWVFNNSGSDLPIIGIGWNGRVSENGLQDELPGDGTILDLPDNRKALVFYDADGFVRVSVVGQADLVTARPWPALKRIFTGDLYVAPASVGGIFQGEWIASTSDRITFSAFDATEALNWAIVGAADRGFAPMWQASSQVRVGELRRASVSAGEFLINDLITSGSTRITGTTFDDTEAGNWNYVVNPSAWTQIWTSGSKIRMNEVRLCPITISNKVVSGEMMSATATHVAGASWTSAEFDGHWVALTGGMQTRYPCVSDTDLNTLVTPREYFGITAANCVNGPTAVQNWTCTVYGSQNGRLFQEFLDMDANAKWRRTSSNSGSAWTIWRRDDTNRVLDWAASTNVDAFETRRATASVGGFKIGDIIRSISLRATGLTFDLTESGFWILAGSRTQWAVDLGTGLDFDTMVTPGFFFHNGGDTTLHAPGGIGFRYSAIVEKDLASYYITQTAWGPATATVWKRQSSNQGTTWTSWRDMSSAIIYDWAASTGVSNLELKRVATANAGQFAVGDTARSNSTRTTGATFDATEAGNWTMISRVLCSVSLVVPSNVTIATGFEPIYFSFATELADTHNFHDNTTNPTRITVPATGIYLLAGKCVVNTAPTQSYRVFAYRINGTGNSQFVTMIDSPADIGMPLSGSQTLVLNAGDYVEVGLGNFGMDTFTTGDNGSVSLTRV
jgi:hypothetical protein